MLTIEIFGYGNEFYKHVLNKSDFDEVKFLEDHKDDYFELEDDNFDMMIANQDRISIIVNLDGKEVYNEQGSLGKELKVSLEKEINSTWGEFVELDESKKTVIWWHGGIISTTFTFNKIDNFSIEKLKIFRMSLDNSADHEANDKYITGIQYDSTDPDDEVPDFTPKYGYDGPKVY